jgi:COX assembly protein 2
MHPPLLRPHPQCSELVNLLIQCHQEHPVQKFFGACNEYKNAMDSCFKSEKEKKRAANAQVAKERRNKFESALAARDLNE